MTPEQAARQAQIIAQLEKVKGGTVEATRAEAAARAEWEEHHTPAREYVEYGRRFVL